jgi:hypothetical protein
LKASLLSVTLTAGTETPFAIDLRGLSWKKSSIQLENEGKKLLSGFHLTSDILTSFFKHFLCCKGPVRLKKCK